MSTGSTGAFGPVVVRRRLGAALRRLREEAGLRLDQVAAELEWSASKISRLETGHSIAKTWDVRNLLTVYGMESGDLRADILRWVEEARAVAWWQPFSDADPGDLDYFISLEAEASSIHHFCSVIPGLLQTEGYARAILTDMLTERHGLSDSAIDGLVNVRVKRQEVLAREDDPLALRVVLDEGALLHRIGDDGVMTAQLRHLLALRHNVDLRIRPLSAPVRRYGLSPWTIFFPRQASYDPVIVCVEAAGRDHYVEESGQVDEFRSAFAGLLSDSLDNERSVELIRQLIR
ncbi:helix-turn-helix transcriptional regulator [Actinomycetospora corticicola]|uniref:Transcriptional regulator with XRE-family HTH domain n=1 Tax=Actinomycetospora corticicola TaxID=663602 RepID=A0A7Y9DYZ4_9PSEU|nr:transcriptional regulator with XRE-family HTH domain [Actinomycetospora corticicola]